MVDLSSRIDNLEFLPLQPVEKLDELLNLADIHVLPQKAGAADLVMPSKLTGMLASCDMTTFAGQQIAFWSKSNPTKNIC